MFKFLFRLKCVIVLLLTETSLVNLRLFASGETIVSRSFVRSRIVPNVVPKAPKGFIKVQYCGGVEVLLGNELSPLLVQTEPRVQYVADPNKFYTLALVDPDAPFPALPLLREFKHWLVVNIPGDRVNAGEILAAYVGSTPPPGSPPHRYVFLVYQQPGKLKFDEKKLLGISQIDRTNFSIADFARKYHLGNPIAGNFFLSKFLDIQLPASLKCPV